MHKHAGANTRYLLFFSFWSAVQNLDTVPHVCFAVPEPVLLFTLYYLNRHMHTCTHARKVPLDPGCEEHVANKHHTCAAVISSLVRVTRPFLAPFLLGFFKLPHRSSMFGKLESFKGFKLGGGQHWCFASVQSKGFAELCWLWQKWSCWQMFNDKISTALTLRTLFRRVHAETFTWYDGVL